jgi:septum formation protein
MVKEIILASKSDRRKTLLEWAEVPFEIITRGTDETYPEGMPVLDIPVHIAREKALTVQDKIRESFHGEFHQHRPILAADTLVVLKDKVIGKPTDRDDAIRILQSFSGQQHQVITGVVILFDGKEIAFADVTEVYFHELSQNQIEFYVDKYEPYDKAGAYAIQEWIGVVGIERISGDFYNVMGLPISRVLKSLETLQ